MHKDLTISLRLVLEQGYSQAEAARSLGVGCTAISRWVQEFNARGDDAFPLGMATYHPR